MNQKHVFSKAEIEYVKNNCLHMSDADMASTMSVLLKKTITSRMVELLRTKLLIMKERSGTDGKQNLEAKIVQLAKKMAHSHAVRRKNRNALEKMPHVDYKIFLNFARYLVKGTRRDGNGRFLNKQEGSPS